MALTKDEIQLSQRTAQRLLNEPEFCAALAEIREAYLGSWQRTTPDETAKRETAYFLYKAICDVEVILKAKAMSAVARDKQEAADRLRKEQDGRGSISPAG